MTDGEAVTFVYTGTITVHYGIFEAIEFIKNIRKALPDASLHIIGYAPDKNIWQKVMQQIRPLDYIKTEGGTSLVPHAQIIKALSTAHFCLMPYHDNRSTAGRIPTKLYECLALETPVIISPNNAWNDLIKENDAGLIHDFQSNGPVSINQLQRKFYSHGLSARYLWNKEEKHLISVVDKLLS